MDQTRDELGILKVLIHNETRYLRHYLGRVLSSTDPKQKGRVLVAVPELGWESEAVGAWCSPRERHALDLPEVDEWVEVYFMGGDENRPVYMGAAQEMKNMVPAAFDGRLRVLFQDPKTRDFITYDPDSQLLDLVEMVRIKKKDGKIEIRGASKKFVTHTELNAALQNFITALNLHVHPTAATGPPSPPTTPMSLDISSAKTDNVLTDG